MAPIQRKSRKVSLQEDDNRCGTHHFATIKFGRNDARQLNWNSEVSSFQTINLHEFKATASTTERPYMPILNHTQLCWSSSVLATICIEFQAFSSSKPFPFKQFIFNNFYCFCFVGRHFSFSISFVHLIYCTICKHRNGNASDVGVCRVANLSGQYIALKTNLHLIGFFVALLNYEFHIK